MNCEWNIAVAPGRFVFFHTTSSILGNQIRLSFTAIDDLESADPSGYCTTFSRNYIDVTEGPQANYDLLKRYCRKEVNPDAFISQSNKLNVKYIQHGGSNYGGLFGFMAHFSTGKGKEENLDLSTSKFLKNAVQKCLDFLKYGPFFKNSKNRMEEGERGYDLPILVCKNINLTSPHGTLQTPGYPGRVTDPRNCKWTIITSPGSRILIHFHKFQISDASDYDRYYARDQQPCIHNYVEVRKKGSNVKKKSKKWNFKTPLKCDVLKKSKNFNYLTLF